jgi:hypothetical protein
VKDAHDIGLSVLYWEDKIVSLTVVTAFVYLCLYLNSERFLMLPCVVVIVVMVVCAKRRVQRAFPYRLHFAY